MKKSKQLCHIPVCDIRQDDHFPFNSICLYGMDQTGSKRYEFNSFGFRGEDYDPDADLTIIIVGCSIVFGTGLNYEETLGAQFKLLLAEALQIQPERINLINLAVGGSSNDYHCRTILKYAPLFRPDLIIYIATDYSRTEIFYKNAKTLLFNAKVLERNPYLLDIIDDRTLAYFDYYDEDSGKVNTLKNALLIQNYCRNESIPLLLGFYDLYPYIVDSTNPALNTFWESLNKEDLIKVNGCMLYSDSAADYSHPGPISNSIAAHFYLIHLAHLYSSIGNFQLNKKLIQQIIARENLTDFADIFYNQNNSRNTLLQRTDDYYTGILRKTKALNNIIVEDGNNPYYFFFKANNEIKQKNYELAEKHLKRAITLDTKAVGYYIVLSNLYRMRGDIDNAIETLERAVVFDKKNVRILMTLGKHYYSIGQYENAKNFVTMILDASPKHEEAHLQLSHIYNQLGNTRLAIQHIQRAITIQNDNATSYLHLGTLFKNIGNIQDAKDALERAIALDPSLPGPHIQLSHIYNQLGNTELAIQQVQEAIAIKKDAPHFYLHLGILFKNIGNIQDAKDALERAIALDPSLPGPHIQLSHIYNQLGNTKLAIQQVQEAIAIKKDTPHFYFHLGNLLRNSGDIEGAEHAQEKAASCSGQ